MNGDIAVSFGFCGEGRLWSWEWGGDFGGIFSFWCADYLRGREPGAMAAITRLSNTYGTSFLLLITLCYFTQGLRCFPWMAMTYWYKDNLKVRH
jgi:hypothetical protein